MDYDNDIFLHTGMVTMMWLEDDHASVTLYLVDSKGVQFCIKSKSVEFIRGYVALGTQLSFEGTIAGITDNRINVVVERLFTR